MQHALRLRSAVSHKMRCLLVDKLNFVDVETPTLFRTSPGGAKEFLVASSQQPQHYYALTQSPQQLKQLLMVGMIDRYFQFAKCYRDEAQFSDRQLEFTQLDLEVSFESKDFIQDTIEQLIVHSWPAHLNPPPSAPFLRMTYDQVLTRFGTDKPDLRYEDIQLVDVTQLVKQVDADWLKSNGANEDETADLGYALVIPNGQELTNKEIHKIIQGVEKELRWMVTSINIGKDGKWHRHPFKNIDDDVIAKFNDQLKCKAGDILFISTGPKDLVCVMLGRLRTRLISKLCEVSSSYQRDASDFRFLWVEDFPLFMPKYIEGKGRYNKNVVWESCHHPFTAPHPDDLQYMKSDPGRVRGLHFDLVLNGNEIGGGSMRISDSSIQHEVLDEILKLDCSNFEYLIEALTMGAPVHGGIALGLDRYFAVLLGKSTIRDVIAFPKSSNAGACLMSDCPTFVPLEEK